MTFDEKENMRKFKYDYTDKTVIITDEIKKIRTATRECNDCRIGLIIHGRYWCDFHHYYNDELKEYEKDNDDDIFSY